MGVKFGGQILDISSSSGLVNFLLLVALALLSPLTIDRTSGACVTAQCKNLRKQQQFSQRSQQGGTSGDACKPFYLIPGKAMDCSTKDFSTKILSIDPSSVTISPNPVKLPGCFTIRMNVNMLPLPQDFSRSYVSKVEFNWWNLPQFSSLPCQNQSSNGCGGYGNNCFYCDVCNSLEKLKHDPGVSKDQLGRQFYDLTCPSKPGVYSFSREFCFNDFHEFDKDNDCQFDFLQEDGLAKTYKDALKNLQQVGYGTVTAKFTLSTNATDDQEKQKFNKEREIERDIERDLTKRRLENGWDVDNEQYLVFKRWFTQLRKDQWHKQEYLPWLLYYNRVGCLSVSFNVCDKEPTPLSRGQTWQVLEINASSNGQCHGAHNHLSNASLSILQTLPVTEIECCVSQAEDWPWGTSLRLPRVGRNYYQEFSIKEKFFSRSILNRKFALPSAHAAFENKQTTYIFVAKDRHAIDSAYCEFSPAGYPTEQCQKPLVDNEQIFTSTCYYYGNLFRWPNQRTRFDYQEIGTKSHSHFVSCIATSKWGITMAAFYTLIRIMDYELNFNTMKTLPSYARSIKYIDRQVIFHNIGTIDTKTVQALFDKLLLDLPETIMRLSDEEFDSIKKMQAEHFMNKLDHVDFHWEAIAGGTYNLNLGTVIKQCSPLRLLFILHITYVLDVNCNQPQYEKNA